MTDPREAKLPVWAQDLLTTERRKSALSWPTEPEPEPYMVGDGGTGYLISGTRPPDGTRLWKCNVHSGKVFPVWIKGTYEHRAPEPTDAHTMGGSRFDGAYYETEREAHIAWWWTEARASAVRLHNVRSKIEGP